MRFSTKLKSPLYKTAHLFDIKLVLSVMHGNMIYKYLNSIINTTKRTVFNNGIMLGNKAALHSV